jgi:hypothetical protein
MYKLLVPSLRLLWLFVFFLGPISSGVGQDIKQPLASHSERYARRVPSTSSLDHANDILSIRHVDRAATGSGPRILVNQERV